MFTFTVQDKLNAIKTELKNDNYSIEYLVSKLRLMVFAGDITEEEKNKILEENNINESDLDLDKIDSNEDLMHVIRSLLEYVTTIEVSMSNFRLKFKEIDEKITELQNK